MENISQGKEVPSQVCTMKEHPDSSPGFEIIMVIRCGI